MSLAAAGWPERLSKVERALDAKAPDDFRRFIATHTHDSLVGQAVTTNPDYWGVGFFYELGNGPDWAQLDETFRICGDVLPGGSLPIGDDGFGNLIVLSCAEGTYGQVAWWNHEREPDDDSVEVMASSFTEFLTLLAPEQIESL